MSLYKDLVRSAAANGRANSTGWVRVNCPVCVYERGSRDDGQALGVNAVTGWFRCFRCDVSGCLGDKDLLGIEYDDIKLVEDFKLPWGCEPLFTAQAKKDPEAREALHYLTETRKYTETQLTLVMAHYTNKGYWQGRVLFPHYYKDKLWGWTGRSYTGKHEKKAIYPAGMSRAQLYNQEVLEFDSDIPVLGVESVTSSIRYQPHVVAYLGQPTEDHMKTLSGYTRRLFINVLDADHWRDCRRVSRELRHTGTRAKAILLPPARDPASLEDKQHTPETMYSQIMRAVDYLKVNPDNDVDLTDDWC